MCSRLSIPRARRLWVGTKYSRADGKHGHTVARDVYFGNHSDMALGGILHHLPHLLLRVISPVRQGAIFTGVPEVFAFLKDVFSELCDIFPGQYIHVGGDECAKRWWQESEDTQKFMRDNGLKDEKALQSPFIHYVQSSWRTTWARRAWC